MTNNYKIWIIFSLVIVFMAGIVCGILLEKNVLDRDGKESSQRRRSTHFPTMEIMAKELSLTSEQQDKIKEFFSSNEARFRALRSEVHKSLSDIRTQMVADIKSVLDENQSKKFEAMIERYKTQRRREHEERKKQADQSHRDRGDRE